jgi:uncharacterized protein (TIGR03435 family)
MQLPIASVAGLVFAFVAALAQEPKPAFEVASVRPIPKADNGRTPCLIQSKPMDLSLRISGNNLRLRIATVASLIMDAYNVREDQFTGLPAWADCWNGYEVNAEAAGGETATQDRVRMMLQTLLTERFQLRLHHETRNLTVYELTIGKSSVKLKLFPDRTAGHRNGWGLVLALIEGKLDYPLVDKTGLTGYFDTNYAPKWDEAKLREELQQARPASLPPGVAFRGLAPSIFHEVEAEYGLTLKKVSAPSDFIVVDHVEKPSEN